MEKGKYYYQVIMWLLLTISYPLVVGTLFVLSYDVLKTINRGRPLSTIFFSSVLPFLFIFSVFGLSNYIYRRNMFSLKEFRVLCEKMHMKIYSIQRKYIENIFGPTPEPFGYLVQGRTGDSIFYALLEKPLYTYYPGYTQNAMLQASRTKKFERWVKYFGGYESECEKHPTEPYIIMNYTSRVNLFHFFSGSPYDIDLEIKYNTAEQPNINTKCPEINQVVLNFLQEIDYFHWRIIFNDNWLRLMIIGGAWQGEMFGKNIENGTNCFRELIARLEGKYTVRDLKKLDVQWDKKTWDFVLVKT